MLGPIVQLMSYYFSESVIRTILRHYPSANVKAVMEIYDTMEQRSREIIDEKTKALSRGDEDMVHRVGEGKDIMSVLRESVSPPFGHSPFGHSPF